MLFKVGAVPFHSWIPDVYQGAPTPDHRVHGRGHQDRRVRRNVCGSSTSRCRDLHRGLATGAVGDRDPDHGGRHRAAVTQTDVKRMLGYSAVANAGFILTGVIAERRPDCRRRCSTCSPTAFSTLGAFAVVSLVRDPTGEEETEMSRWAGLGRRSPVVGRVLFAVPARLRRHPADQRLRQQVRRLQERAADGATALVIVGVITSAIAAYFYVRVIVLMFFTEPVRQTPTAIQPTSPTTAVVAVAAAATVIVGVAPQPLFDLAAHAGQFLR